MDKAQTKRYLQPIEFIPWTQEDNPNRKKWVKDIKRNPTEETEMANKYIKIYLVLPLTRQMKSKTRYHFIKILAKILAKINFVNNIPESSNSTNWQIIEKLKLS